MKLSRQQIEFARRIPRLIDKAFELGYEVTLGDAYRDPRVFGKKGESKGYGKRNSRHKDRLAIDLNLFKEGLYLRATEDHKELGEWWESIGGVWGGRFHDGNHYQAAEDGEWKG